MKNREFFSNLVLSTPIDSIEGVTVVPAEVAVDITSSEIKPEARICYMPDDCAAKVEFYLQVFPEYGPGNNQLIYLGKLISDDEMLHQLFMAAELLLKAVPDVRAKNLDNLITTGYKVELRGMNGDKTIERNEYYQRYDSCVSLIKELAGIWFTANVVNMATGEKKVVRA